MIRFLNESGSQPDSSPGTLVAAAKDWVAVTEEGVKIPWRGLQTGPLTLTPQDVEDICRALLGRSPDSLSELSDRVLVPAIGAKAELPSVILHSTTPDLKTFDGDLDALLKGQKGGDFTTYKEARSVYLAGPGDLAVGRTAAWRAAVSALGADSITLEDSDHYYLSHALLALAARHGQEGYPSLKRLIAAVRNRARVVRLYAFELEMQIFLLWLAQEAGVDELAVEANRPALSAAWNRKSVLHPTLAAARSLPTPLPTDPFELLELESLSCALAQEMGLTVPRVPGYTLERGVGSPEDFGRQTCEAAELLRIRHGLALGCLKASESGDGARITPGLDLTDFETLARLGREAHIHGDDYVLEAHVHYGRAEISGQTLPTALSAHIRGGEVAPGTTIQFMEGTSWKGNILFDAQSAPLFGVDAEHHNSLRTFLTDFHLAFKQKAPGLVLAGIDFALGQVGGHYGKEKLLGVQDLNVSFTGAECLRAFLGKVAGRTVHGCGVTRIYRPAEDADHHAFLDVTRKFTRGNVVADTVAAIPGRWGMVGITGKDPKDAIDNLNLLQAELERAGLISQQS